MFPLELDAKLVRVLRKQEQYDREIADAIARVLADQPPAAVLHNGNTNAKGHPRISHPDFLLHLVGARPGISYREIMEMWTHDRPQSSLGPTLTALAGMGKLKRRRLPGQRLRYRYYIA